MLARVRAWLHAMPAANALEHRLAVLLQVTMLINLPGSSLFFLAAWAQRATLLGAIVAGAVLLSLLLQIAALVMLRRGRMRLAVSFAVLATILPLIVAFWPRGITNSRAIFLNFAVPLVIVAVYVQKRYWLVLTTMLMFGLIVIVGMLEQLTPPLAGFVPFQGDVVVTAIFSALPTFIVLLWTLDGYGRIVRGALQNAYAREQELARANMALQAEMAERIEAERARAEGEAQLRMLIDQMPAMLWTTDRMLHVTSLAGTGLVALDLRSSDIVGQSLAEIFQTAGPAMPTIVAHQQALHGETVTYEDRWHDHTYQVHVEPLREHHDHIAGTIGVALDISDRKRLETQLLQAQKMDAIGRLAGGVAHDFNNMLTVITGYAELALTDLHPQHATAPELHEIRKAANRAAALTRQLLAFARKQIIDLQVLNLNDVIRDLEPMLRQLLGVDSELVTLLTPALWPVKIDVGQIEQMLLNLVMNARDAMPHGGKVTIETTNLHLDDADVQTQASITPGDYVLLVVGDTGVGMPPEVREHIFEPFFTTKAPDKGTGLGLATIYGIVMQHGGHIHVDSERDLGTVFTVYLPRAIAPLDQHIPSTAPETLPRGHETVLVVDDEPAVRALAGRVLGSLGYTVLEAPNGADALHIAQNSLETIHLLLSDMVMPQLGGSRLAEQLRADRPHIHVLFISGYSDSAAVQHSQLDPSIAHLQKPFTPAQLARKVRDVLDALTLDQDQSAS